MRPTRALAGCGAGGPGRRVHAAHPRRCSRAAGAAGRWARARHRSPDCRSATGRGQAESFDRSCESACRVMIAAGQIPGEPDGHVGAVSRSSVRDGRRVVIVTGVLPAAIDRGFAAAQHHRHRGGGCGAGGQCLARRRAVRRLAGLPGAGRRRLRAPGQPPGQPVDADDRRHRDVPHQNLGELQVWRWRTVPAGSVPGRPARTGRQLGAR
jgi:hypothetical protein